MPNVEHDHGRALVGLPLSVMCSLCVLSLSIVGCGGGSSRTASHNSNGPTSSAHGSTASVASDNEEKLDPDKDHDGATPDEDDKTPPPHADQDGDTDSNGKTYFDGDDSRILRYGRPAGEPAKREITALVKRYYAAANAENGVKACSMIYSIYAEAVPEDYGTSPPGPAWARGNTCGQVMDRIFAHAHDEIASKFPKLRVTEVRVKGRRGLAVLRFAKIPPSEVAVRLEGKAWRLSTLLDDQLH